jgi:AraC-like DNA-binding protein
MSEYLRRAPDRRVRGLLDRDYIGFSQPASTHERWLATPGQTVTVILNAGTGFGGLPRSFAAGLTDTCGVIDQGGEIECVDLKLTPLGAYTLLGAPMDELTNTVVDLDDLLPHAGRLAEAPTWSKRFALLDELLLDRAEHGPRPAGEAAWVYRRLAESHGAVPIGALAAEVGWSRRHLVTKFRQQVGLPPKTLARIMRFQHLLSSLTAQANWTRLADECGYYDQAHLNRDFREFAGTTPTDYLARLVTSVQYTWVPAA